MKNILKSMNWGMTFCVALISFLTVFLSYQCRIAMQEERENPRRGWIISKHRGQGKSACNTFTVDCNGKVETIGCVGYLLDRYDIGDYFCCCSPKCESLKATCGTLEAAR